MAGQIRITTHANVEPQPPPQPAASEAALRAVLSALRQLVAADDEVNACIATAAPLRQMSAALDRTQAAIDAARRLLAEGGKVPRQAAKTLDNVASRNYDRRVGGDAMATETYMCEFCGEDFEVEREAALYGDDNEGRGLTVYFCCQDHQNRYERGEAPV